MTKKPLNVNDNEVFDGMSRNERPLSEPTAMSYFLQRVKMAEVCRNMVDRTALSMSNYGELSYNDIMDCDMELQTIENEYQPFWTMSETQLVEKYNLTCDEADRIRSQGHMAYFFVYTNRLKWHLPYCNRALTEPVYSALREMCLRYASKVIKLQTRMKHAQFRNTTSYYFACLLLGVFMSSVVLLMDLCRNRSSPNFEKQREEVAEAFRLLEDAKEESELASQLVNTLMHILQKHKLPPPKPSNRHNSQAKSPDPLRHYQPASVTASTSASFPSDNQCNKASPMSFPLSNNVLDPGNSMDYSKNETNGADLASCFGEVTQNFENGGDVGNVDWNELFSEMNLPSFI